MSVSRCIAKALDIAKAPRQQWKASVDALPEQCQHVSICTGGIGCRARIADYLRVQYRAQARREQLKGVGAR
ncbi:hypothetical protein KWH07_06205 [Xanthomonas campestris pv. zingibericola]|uniref:hypothetical protein n=1 Tax=Xanthomonas euvesicatoria TaxID=456327 RepID=UPI001C47AD69|nr:hypothetical protein [Xanthomonas euvesicatoria]MBV6857236.1 hypothetical protein [Xanthomonas campestris pv. zingibericola]